MAHYPRTCPCSVCHGGWWEYGKPFGISHLEYHALLAGAALASALKAR